MIDFVPAFLRLPLVLLWVPPSHLRVLLVVHEEEQRGSAASGMSAVAVFGLCGVSTNVQRFSSNQLCSALRAYTTPSSVLTRCSSVRSLLPRHTADFHVSASFGAGFPDPFPAFGR